MSSIDFDCHITLEEAALISGLTVSTIRTYANNGRLRTVRMGRRLSMTTRRWLDDYLNSRNRTGPGQPPKALPVGYLVPPPKRRKVS